jgi:putative two-component system response regulator
MPRDPDMNAETLWAAPPPLAATTGSGDEALPTLRRILLVDDEPGVLASLAAMLERNRFEVVAAGDAIQARALLEEGPVDVVITDIAMPEVSGLDLLREVRSRPDPPEVLMMTGYLDIGYAIEAMRRGAYDFFTKPLNFERILLTLARVEEKRRLQEQARRYERLKTQKAFEEQAMLETALGLARAVEERDKYNIGHARRTANYALMIADALEFDEERRRHLRYAALLHDIGKIGIDDRILNKPGSLTDDERATIRKHSEIGDYIIAPISFLRGVARFIRHHHEAWDGSGYPDGLAGEAIPLEARILCVADYFDSVTSARTYRDPMPLPEALSLIKSESGRLFDPELSAIFLRQLARTHVGA